MNKVLILNKSNTYKAFLLYHSLVNKGADFVLLKLAKKNNFGHLFSSGE